MYLIILNYVTGIPVNKWTGYLSDATTTHCPLWIYSNLLSDTSGNIWKKKTFYICVSINNGLSPCRRQAIIWTNAGIFLIANLGPNVSEILSEIHTFSFKKMHLKIASAKWRSFCLGLNMLIKETVKYQYAAWHKQSCCFRQLSSPFININICD